LPWPFSYYLPFFNSVNGCEITSAIALLGLFIIIIFFLSLFTSWEPGGSWEGAEGVAAAAAAAAASVTAERIYFNIPFISYKILIQQKVLFSKKK